MNSQFEENDLDRIRGIIMELLECSQKYHETPQ
jgi:hypothetical protein